MYSLDFACMLCNPIMPFTVRSTLYVFEGLLHSYGPNFSIVNFMSFDTCKDLLRVVQFIPSEATPEVKVGHLVESVREFSTRGKKPRGSSEKIEARGICIFLGRSCSLSSLANVKH
jgi:hypothetical protein